MSVVAVIGGGASGMMAALAASENSNNEVVLFERQNRVGRKLLATGNGRCNLTNTGLSDTLYNSDDTAAVMDVLNSFPPSEVMAWFDRYGLFSVEQYGGRVYPLSDSANSVVDVLRYSLTAAGVRVFTAEPVLKAKRTGGGFLLTTEHQELRCSRLIIACGGKAGGKLGGVSDGYQLLSSFGHSCTELRAALTPLITDSELTKALKGVRADGNLKLLRNGKTVMETEGEIQFTDTGISGPAAFDFSRKAIVGDRVKMDLLPGVPEYRIEEVLKERVIKMQDLTAGEMMNGMVHNRLSIVLAKACGLKPSQPVKELGPDDVKNLSRVGKSFMVTVKGFGSFDNAQITVGGIKLSEFDSDSLESRLVKGLYACGEVLNVDGACGGYNLQWAWASGRLAGLAAGRTDK